MPEIDGSYSLFIGNPPKDKNIKQALFFLASVARILRLLAFALLSFFFRDWYDFALDNIGKTA